MTHDVHDRVARRTGPTWALGTVTGADDVLLIRWDDASTILVARLDDYRIVAVDDVPIDQRHWLTEKVRDQLVRQEAAARLRLASERLVGAGMTAEAMHLDSVVAALEDLLSDSPRHLALAARALLAPAPAPARTP